MWESPGIIRKVTTNGKLVNLGPVELGKRLFALVRRGLIRAGYFCLMMAVWIVGRKGTFILVLWLLAIGAALQLAHLLPELPDDRSPDDAAPPS